jgi:hypothetical protein
MSPSRDEKLRSPQSGCRGLRVGRWLWRVDPYPVLVILFSLFPMGPLLQPGYFWNAHDARHSVYFLFELDRGIQDGLLYPRWQPDFAFGYGYPFFNIYGPLSSYLGEGFHLLGLDYVTAIKAVFALSLVGSGLAMYGFVKRVLGRRAGLVAAVAYMVIPYRLVDIYVRAALAESVAYLFVPLVLWGVWAALHRPRPVHILGLALAFAALIVTHPLTAMLLTLILVLYVAALTLARVATEQPWRGFSRESALPWLGHLGHVVAPAALGLALGVGLSAFFLLPAMAENRFVRVDQWYGGRYAWGGDFVEFFQLFSPRWGFGTSVPGPDDDVSFQLGAVPFVLSLFALWPLAQRSSRRRWDRVSQRLVWFFGAMTGVVVFFMLGLSAPLWQVLPLARLVQFPWRLLMLTVVSMSFLCGAAARGASARENKAPAEPGFPGAACLFLVALLILGSAPYMQVETFEQPVSLAGLMEFQQSSDEMTGSTAWVREIPDWSDMADYHMAGEPLTSKVHYGYLYRQPGGAAARTLELRTTSEVIEYSAQRPILITFNTFYYPGWRAYLLDAETGAQIRELPIALRGELGLITVRVPAGSGRVLLRFEDTPLRSMSLILSLTSLALLGVVVAGGLVLRPGRRG